MMGVGNLTELTEADTTVQACWDADRLDLGRVHVLAARDKHILLAVYHVEIPVLVVVHQVAGMEPECPLESSCCGIRFVIIAFHHIVSTDHDLSDLVDTHFPAMKNTDVDHRKNAGKAMMKVPRIIML